MNPANKFTIHINAISFVAGVFSGVTLPEKITKSPREDWFDPTIYLGKKGHRYFSVPVKYALSAAEQLNLSELAEHPAAVFLGTNTVDFSVRKNIALALSNQSIDNIGAAFAPNCSVNIAAGQLSAKYKLRGASYTYTGADASCIALWQALHDLQQGKISSALVGQVEYTDQQLSNSGAILWHITNKKTCNEQLSIEVVQWQRWLPEYETNFNLIKPINNNQQQHIIYIVSQHSSVADQLTKQLAQHHDLIERINIPAFAQELLPSMWLFSTLSFIVLKKVRGTVLLVSDNGHIFNFNLY